MTHLNKSPLVEVTFYVNAIPGERLSNARAADVARAMFSGFDSIKTFPDSKHTDEGVIVAEKFSDKIAVIVKSNVFSFSLRGSYTNWDAYIHEAKTFMEKFVNITKPLRFSRVGVRNINEILGVSLDDEPALKQMSGCSITDGTMVFERTMSATEYHRVEGLYSAVIQAEKPYKVGEDLLRRYMLDIDVFMLSKQGFTDEQVFTDLPKLRKLKDKIFVAALSEKALSRMR